MVFAVPAMFLLLLAGNLTAQAASSSPESFTVPGLAGFAMAPDNKTLIVATGSAGELIYFDTVANKKGKHVEVEF